MPCTWGIQLLDMCAGTEAALARVMTVIGAAGSHHAYLFASLRFNCTKVLMHDCVRAWLAARRPNSGKLVWPKDSGGTLTLSWPQFDAPVLGLAPGSPSEMPA